MLDALLKFRHYKNTSSRQKAYLVHIFCTVLYCVNAHSCLLILDSVFVFFIKKDFDKIHFISCNVNVDFHVVLL